LVGASFAEWSPARWLLVRATALVLSGVRGRLINTVIIYHSLITISGVFAYTEAPVLIQNISFLANTSKTADCILTSTVCTNAGDLGAFIYINAFL